MSEEIAVIDLAAAMGVGQLGLTLASSPLYGPGGTRVRAVTQLADRVVIELRDEVPNPLSTGEVRDVLNRLGSADRSAFHLPVFLRLATDDQDIPPRQFRVVTDLLGGVSTELGV